MEPVQVDPVAATHALQALQQAGFSLAQLTPALKLAKAGLDAARTVKIGVSAAITADSLGLFLRKQAALNGMKATVLAGNFDDPVGDMQRFAAEGVEQLVLIPFLDNVLPHFESQAATLSAADVDAKLAEFSARYSLTLQQAASFAAVFVCGLHRITPSLGSSAPDLVDGLLERFNAVLHALVQKHANARWVATGPLIQELGLRAALDLRFLFRAKAPYTPAYMDALAGAISSASRGFGSYFYKCLVLDCDNTLWGGILGEDGVQGVKLNPHDFPGNVFWRVQHQLSALQAQGVLLCLCSKNNPADVQEMLASHPSMVLKPDQIVLSKVNWEDKPSNLRAIAAELNLGLDSLIFVDDSDFECNAVRSQLPQVRVLQVPANLPDYPALIAQAGRLLIGAGVSAESQDKTAQYRMRAQALALQAEFGSQDEYLKSLQLQVVLSRNAVDSIARISELSRKSNQFNLTTRRYSEAQIAELMASPLSAVYSLVVKDRFGDSGLTGVVVMKYEAALARVDNFFMSCRVIGRGVEQVIWARIAEQALQQGCSELRAEFVPSAKNALVAAFYDELGLPRLGVAAGQDGTVTYTLQLASASLPAKEHIELTHVG